MPCEKTFQPIGELYATHPGRDNSRYKSSQRSQLTSLAVEVGNQSSPTYLPLQWSAYVQPEGKTYFHFDGPLATVTESWMFTSEVAAEAEKWIFYIGAQLREKEVELTDLELCIRIDEDKDCLYYIVDKRNQSLFWLKDFDTEELGLPSVVSSSHLRMSLEAQFWLHIDRFPAHFGGLPESDLLKILDIYTHARMDQITSLTSTFSYSPADTTAFYDLLQGCRGRTSEPEVVSTIARAWNLVLHNRFYNQYGEETPRLDSTMSIVGDQEEEREGFSKGALAFLTFGKSEKYRAHLNRLYLDKYVYSHRVHAFIENAVKEWKEIPAQAFAMLFLHGSFFFIVASQVVAAISAACLSVSLITSFALIQQHGGMLEHRNSPLAIEWISERESEKYKFQRLAFAFALPTAFFNWGLVFLFTHWLWIVLSRLDFYVAATFMSVIALACVAFILVTSPNMLHFPRPTLFRIFRKEQTDESDKSMV